MSQTTTPELVAFHWDGERLAPETDFPVEPPAGQTLEVTLLHTNDFHSCIDGPERGPKDAGGLARIATSIKAARQAGPTIVVDSGDSVFGSPTFWCTRGAGPTARLRGAAGYQLAAIGNHDLEHGLDGLRELLQGGYRLVANNVRFADPDLDRQVAPAYAANVDGFRIGFTGVTTLDTPNLIPRRMLDGVRFLHPFDATLQTVRALEPYVDAIVVLSHLGFDNHELTALMPNGQVPKMMQHTDRALAPQLKGSKVAAILGGHTHDALQPTPMIGGIFVSNSGSYGLNLGEVKLRLGPDGTVEVRSQLVRQDASVGEDADLLEARARELESFAPFMDQRVPLPDLPRIDMDPPANSHGLTVNAQQYQLLVNALDASGKVSSDAIVMVPPLYLLGQLPGDREVRQADVLVAYPNIESLVELTMDGESLKRLVQLQPTLMFFEAARPLRLADAAPLQADEVDDSAEYKVITSELAAEGGLHWDVLPSAARSVRSLEASCADVVWSYLLAQAALVGAAR